MQRKELRKESQSRDASSSRIGIVVSTYYGDIAENMLNGALEILQEWHVAEDHIEISRVSGSFEIPYACLKLIKDKHVNAVIALGCIVKGETKHDEYIASAVAQGIMRLSLENIVPISFGVLTTNTLEQAIARSSGSDNKGKEAALAALQSVLL